MKSEDIMAVLEKHSLWLAGCKQGIRANLSEANLIGADLSRANLSRANLSSANLSEADLSSANLSGIDLSSANLSEANLSRANLSEADLSSANLSEANLSRANLSEADLSSANLSSANLSRANLSGANLSSADLSEANLSEANLSRANLSEADLSSANLSSANLSEANLSEANLSEAIGLVKFMGVETGNYYWKRIGENLMNNDYQFVLGLNKLRDGEQFASDERVLCSSPGFHFASQSWCNREYGERKYLCKIRIPQGAKINEPWATDGKASADMIEILEVYIDTENGLKNVTSEFLTS